MNRKAHLTAVALAIMLAQTPAHSFNHANLPSDLAEAIDNFDQAQVNGDAAMLTRLLADDYVLVNSLAKIEHKADFIRNYTALDWKLMPYVIEDETIRQWNGGAVLAGVTTLQGMSDGKAFKTRLRFADIWRKQDGIWQVIFTQVMREPVP